MRYMTAERCHELRAECVRDLEQAKIEKNTPWVVSLNKRLAKLNELIYGTIDKCLIVQGK